MSSFNFVENVEKQNIFHQWFDNPVTRNNGVLSRGNKIASTANKDLFVAVENTIRCCTINSRSNNYKLISTKFMPFDIAEISLNPAETFIYSTDFKRVVVQNFPFFINSAKSLNRSTIEFELEGIEAPIKKIVWNSYIMGGLGLALLLENNKVLFYDLNIVSRPMRTVDLSSFDNFKGEIATSISYGSNTNLMGGLTLYVATSYSKVYAFFPFLSQNSRLAVTKKEVETAITDSTAALSHITKEYPGTGNDKVNESIRRQIHAFQEMLYQFKGSTTEVKKLFGSPVFCQHVKTTMTGTPQLQGPLVNLHMGKIADICNFGNHDQTPLLVAINADKTDLRVNYLAQITPLILEYKESEQKKPILQLQDSKQVDATEAKEPGKEAGSNEPIKEVKPKEPVEGAKPKEQVKEAKATEAIKQDTPEGSANKKEIIKESKGAAKDEPSYAKPKLGFGYVDDEDDEDEVASKDTKSSLSSGASTVSESATEALTKEEYIKNMLTVMYEVGIDILSGVTLGPHPKILASNVDPKKIILFSPTKTAIVTNNGWPDSLPLGGKEISNNYDFVDNKDNASSVALIKDDITFTGMYLINYSPSGTEKPEVLKIPDPEQEALATSVGQLKITDGVVPKPVVQSKLPSNLLAEVDNDLKKASELVPKNTKVTSTDSSVDALSKVNRFSLLTLERIGLLDKVAMKMSLKLSASVLEIKHQTKLLKSQAGSNKDTEAKLAELSAKQKMIMKKLDQLQSKVAGAVEDIKIRKQTPLSDSEKAWFEEINQVTATTNKDTSLTRAIDNLKTQVEYIKKNINVKPAIESNSFEDLRGLRSQVSKSLVELKRLRNAMDMLTKEIDDKKAASSPSS